MSDLINQIKSNNNHLKPGEIEGILYLFKNHPNLTNNLIIQLTGLPKETLRVFKKSSATLLEDSESDEIVLSAAGKEALSTLVLKPYTWSLLTYANKEIESKLINLRKEMNLEPKRDFDQFFATENGSVAKVMSLLEKDMIAGKNICLLGDDDLISITIGLIDQSYNKITVFDVDRELLSKIAATAAKLAIKNIETVLYDVRTDIRREYIGKYDVVMTDPPYTPNGISLFINRCLGFIGNTTDFSGKYIYLFYGNSFKSPEKTLKIQEIISNYNLVVEDKIDKFVRYNGAESIGSASALYILKTTQFSKPLSYEPSAQIYTYENTAEERFPFVDHFTFKLFKVSQDILKSQKEIGKAVETICHAHKFNVVDSKITKFKKQGYTFTFVLSTSNLLIHTWPEHNALHIDLLTCSPIYNKEMLGRTVAKAFKTNFIEERKVE